jgi:hypothetical protein
VILTAHAIGFFSRSDTVMVTNGEAADHQMTLRRQRWIPFVGVHVGGPAVGSLAIGPAVLTRPAGSHPPRTDQGLLFAVVEPGVEAGRVSAGFLPAMGQMGSGVQARATILRKWKTPTQTFVGGELTLMPFFVMGPRIGVFNRIRGGAGWFVFVDFGFGG